MFNVPVRLTGLVRRLSVGLVVMMLAGWAAAAGSRQVVPFQGAVAVKPGQPPLDGSPYGAKFEIFDAAPY